MNRFRLKAPELDVVEARLDIEFHSRLNGNDGWNSPRWTAYLEFPAEDGPRVMRVYQNQTEVLLKFGNRYCGPAVIVEFAQDCRGVMMHLRTTWRGVGPFVAA